MQKKALLSGVGGLPKECLLPASLKPARSVPSRAAEISARPVQLVLLVLWVWSSVL